VTNRGERGAGGKWPMGGRSVLATVLGIPPVAAVGLGAALTAIGVFADLVRIGSLGLVFTICYIAGCALAVTWVRRDGLFGPMVQPPLLVAVAVPAVVLLAGSPKPGAGVAERLLVVGAPLVNAFPTMAWTTGIVLAIGVARLIVQRPLDVPAPAPTAAGEPPVSARRGSAAGRGAAGRGRDAARGAARTSGSPRRS
jgi:hypothetical protein